MTQCSWCAVAIVAGAFLSNVAVAQLSWEQEELSFIAPVGEPHVVAEYHFSNRGKRNVTFLAVEPSCSCTTSELVKKVYAPGEKGTLRVTFHIGDRTGLHAKSIAVKTDDPERPEVRLIMVVDLLEPPSILPRFLYWTVGDKPTPKALVVRAPADGKLAVHSARVEGGRFTVRTETVEQGREYRITVTPASTGRPVDATLNIQTDWPASSDGTLKAYVRIIAPQRKPAGG